MPGNNYTPKGMLSTECDLTQWQGAHLYSIDVNDVYAPADWSTFADIDRFLNGYGCTTTEGLLQDIRDVAAVPGLDTGWTVGITDEDRIYIESIYDFEVTQGTAAANAGLASALGFNDWPSATRAVDMGAHPTIPPNNRYRVTAPLEWVRGHIADSRALALDFFVYSGENEAFSSLASVGFWSSVLEYVRTRTVTDSLTEVHYASGISDNRERWSLNDNGRVVLTQSSAAALITWVDEDFRNALGFTGAEEYTINSDGGKQLTATYPPKWVYPLTGSFAYFEPTLIEHSRTSVAADGYRERTHIASETGRTLRFMVDGAATTNEMLRHFQVFYRELHKANSFTVYQNIQDRRTAAGLYTDYSLTHTPEMFGNVGSRRLVVNAESAVQSLELEDPRVRLRYPVEILAYDYVAP